MNRLAIVCVVSFALLGSTGLLPSALAMVRGLAAQGPVMKAHFIDVGQANRALLECQCGVVLIEPLRAAGWLESSLRVSCSAIHHTFTCL